RGTPMKHIASYAWLATLIVTAAAQARAETKTLQVALHLPATSHVGRNIIEFAKTIEAQTKGTVKIEISDKAQFRLDNQASQAAAMGVVELGRFAAAVPGVGIFLQPFVFNFDQLVWAATKQGSELRTIVEDEILQKTGLRVLWWQPSGLSVILSMSKPVSNPEALQGRTVQVFDTYTEEFVKACGGAARLASTANLSQVLETTGFDSALTAITNVTDLDLWRVARVLTKIQNAPLLSLVVMSESAWQGLTQEQQKIISDMARDAEERVWDAMAAIEGDAYVLAIAKGLKIYELDRDDIKAWRICSSSVLESYVEKAGEVGERLFAAYGRLRTDPCCNPASGTLSLGRY
ncbi:MAG: TRAP transporter substrate-binding protein DctP, partial [Hyphomicrobiaceae bacterium]